MGSDEPGLCGGDYVIQCKNCEKICYFLSCALAKSEEANIVVEKHRKFGVKVLQTLSEVVCEGERVLLRLRAGTGSSQCPVNLVSVPSF